MEFGAKVRILKTKTLKTRIAFLSHLIVPTGSIERTDNKYGSVNKLCVSHEITENTGIGYNIGYDYFGESGGNLTYSLAFGVGVNEKAGVFIESYGELVNLETFISNFDAGFTYLVNNNLQFDFSFGAGVNQRMNFISAGFSWLIEKE